jgi:hypothetical protein
VIVIRETSGGTIAMSFTYVTRSIGLTAGIGCVDDKGWVDESVKWSSEESGGRSLGDAIGEAVPIPKDEAERLAESALRELHERGGDRSDMTRRDWVGAGALLTLAGGLVFVAALAVLAALVWAAIELI